MQIGFALELRSVGVEVRRRRRGRAPRSQPGTPAPAVDVSGSAAGASRAAPPHRPWSSRAPPVDRPTSDTTPTLARCPEVQKAWRSTAGSPPCNRQARPGLPWSVRGDHRRRWRCVVFAAIAAGSDIGASLGGRLGQPRFDLARLPPAALVLQTLQFAFSAAASHGILRYAYPATVSGTWRFRLLRDRRRPEQRNARERRTIVTVLMSSPIIPTATVTGVLARPVEAAPSPSSACSCSVYLFLAVGGSFERKFGFLSGNRWAVVVAIVGAGVVRDSRRTTRVAVAEASLGRGPAGRRDPLRHARIRRTRGGSAGALVVLQGCGGRRAARRLRHPRGLPHPLQRAGRQRAREPRLPDAGRRRRRPGLQCRLAPRIHERRDRKRVLDRAAAPDDGLERRRRGCPRRCGVRPVRREAARRGVVCQGERAPRAG